MVWPVRYKSAGSREAILSFGLSQGINLYRKGSVQQKLRCINNSVNGSVLDLDHGARLFFVRVSFHLEFKIFPFPVNNAQFTVE